VSSAFLVWLIVPSLLVVLFLGTAHRKQTERAIAKDNSTTILEQHISDFGVSRTCHPLLPDRVVYASSALHSDTQPMVEEQTDNPASSFRP